MFFITETEQGVAYAILQGVVDFSRDPWPRVSDRAKSLVRQMLEPDPRRRMTAQEVLGKYFFTYFQIARWRKFFRGRRKLR